MLATSYLIPRSMRWLLLKGLEEEARESMRYVYKTGVDREFQILLDSLAATTTAAVASNNHNHDNNKKRVFLARRYPKAFRASLGLTVLQQLSGKPSLEGLSAIIFAAAGLGRSSSVWMSLYMIANSIVTVFLVDRLGRRVLLQTGNVMQLVALLSIGLAFWLHQGQSLPPVAQAVVFGGMFLYVGGYEFGYGPITWLVLSEVFPLEIRGEATALMVEINFLVNFLVQFLVGVFSASIGWGPTFVIFGAVMAYAIYFVHYHVPETKGLTLEEIERQLGHHHQEDDDKPPSEETRLI